MKNYSLVILLLAVAILSAVYFKISPEKEPIAFENPPATVMRQASQPLKPQEIPFSAASARHEELNGPAFHRMTVEEAYRAIPHKRTVFDGTSSKIDEAERSFLMRFFELVEIAIVERVEMFSYLQSGGERGQVWRRTGTLFRQLDSLTVPDRLKGVCNLVRQAIAEQRDYLDEWYEFAAAKKPYGFRFKEGEAHSLIDSSSQKLHQAYSQLMQLYPQESSQNKAAFFNYLCALDFI